MPRVATRWMCGGTGFAVRLCLRALTLLENPVSGVPCLMAGGLKIAYDLAIFVAFRRVRPPEVIGWSEESAVKGLGA